MEAIEKNLYTYLQEVGITDYKVFEHEAIFSTEDADKYGIIFPGLNLKNLLIKDKKKNRYYLVILEDHRHMDSSHFKEVTGWGKIRFANEEELWDLLKLKPGSVSPYGLLNDVEHSIVVVLEKAITEASENEILNFHPNRNTATLAMKKKDFLVFLKKIGNPVIFE